MKPKVLFVIFGIQPGGLELYLYRFLEFTKGKINANVFCRYNKIAGSKSPQRVPMIRPSKGVMPMLVSTDFPW